MNFGPIVTVLLLSLFPALGFAQKIESGYRFSFMAGSAFPVEIGSPEFLYFEKPTATAASRRLLTFQSPSGKSRIIGKLQPGPEVELPFLKGKCKPQSGSQPDKCSVEWRKSPLARIAIDVLVDKEDIAEKGYQVIDIQSTDLFTSWGDCETAASAYESPLIWNLWRNVSIDGNADLRSAVVDQSLGLRSIDNTNSSLFFSCKSVVTENQTRFAVVASVYVALPANSCTEKNQ